MLFRIAILITFLTLSFNSIGQTDSIGQIDINLLNEYKGRYLGDYSYWLTCNNDSNLYRDDTIIFTANYPICDDSFGFEFKNLKIKGVGGYNEAFRLVYPKKIAKFYKEEEDWYLKLLVTNDITKVLKLIELSKEQKKTGSKFAFETFQYKMVFVAVKEN